jgi:hypothetical protein
MSSAAAAVVTKRIANILALLDRRASKRHTVAELDSGCTTRREALQWSGGEMRRAALNIPHAAVGMRGGCVEAAVL